MIPWAGRDVMTEKVVRDKVLCYVVRDGRLLVLRHTDYSFEEVGIQVPAGSVRAGEKPDHAALRETREETGLTDFRIVRNLGETEYDISPYRFEIQRRHVLRLANARLARADTSSRRLSTGDGAAPDGRRQAITKIDYNHSCEPGHKRTVYRVTKTGCDQPQPTVSFNKGVSLLRLPVT